MSFTYNLQSMDFLILADEWLIHYASTISKTPIPTLFAVGHALELYLKAALLKYDPTANIFSQGHDIWSMITRLKTEYNILRNLDVHEHIKNKFLNGNIDFYETDSIDAENYRNNIEFYWVAFLLKDIKYLGTHCKSINHGFFLIVKERNPYWVPILKELRQISIPDIAISQNGSYNYTNAANEYIQSIFRVDTRRENEK